MSNDPSIQAQSYDYFKLEAPELLSTLEHELLNLQEGENNIKRVHTMMRTMHTLKGIAATIGLETIKTIAHALEDIFKALCKPDFVLDSEVKAWLFEGYECLRSPLMSELSGTAVSDTAVLECTATIFSRLQDRLGDCFAEDAELPNMDDLGLDMTETLFSASVSQDLQEITTAIADADLATVIDRLRLQAKTFAGVAEATGLVGFGAIAQATLTALDLHSDQALTIAQLALADFQDGYTAVMAGDRAQGGTPSPALLLLAGIEDEPPTLIPTPASAPTPIQEIPQSDATIAQSLEALSAAWIQSELGSVDAITPVEPSSPVDANTIRPQEPEILQPIAHPTLDSDTTRTVKATAQAVPSPTVPSPQTVPAPKSVRVAAPQTPVPSADASVTPPRMVRVNVEHLEQLNYFNAELLTNQNRQFLQDGKMQRSLRKIISRLRQFQNMLGNLQEWSDRLTLSSSPAQFHSDTPAHQALFTAANTNLFDALELDSYGEFHVFIQSLLEETCYLEDETDALEQLNRQATQLLNKQRKLLTNSRDVLLEARMLPLGSIFNRFHQVLQQLETVHKKPVTLTIRGHDVLVDKAVAERLYEPILHLVRNSFDHGLESADTRQQLGKPLQGQIEISAYYRGSQLIIDVRDDGQGLNFSKIRQRVIDRGLATAAIANSLSESQLAEFLFETGFSTASQVSDLSGRGVGLDVVRAQLQSVQGTVAIQTEPQRGTTFSLQIPLSLTIDKLLVCQAGSKVYALAVDTVEQILLPKPGQIQYSEHGRVLKLAATVSSHAIAGGELIPIYPLSEIVGYSTQQLQIPETYLESPNSTTTFPLLLLLCQGQLLALGSRIK
jgi:two-component system, chemotaxis family, sensor histidine kinase and response regulator PixL